jgi:pyruvate/2-oxoglutarate dehydrogenase complex dihydrolipoamide acyltransferase (E2) component
MPEPSAILVPQMNVNDDAAVVVAWHVSAGERVRANQRVVTLETTKATFDVHADREGYFFYEHEIKSVVAVGSVLAWISDTPEAPKAARTSAASLSQDGDATGGDARITRKAQRRMRELGVTLAELPTAGRIEVSDVERAASARSGGGAAANAVRAAGAVRPEDYWEPLEQSASKVMEAVRLAEVYRSVVPSMVTMPLSCERVQAKLRTLAGEVGPVSLLELAIHEAAVVLEDYPELNGFVERGRACHYRQIAIGFAVNAGRSLRVPVVRETARLSQLEVCRAVRDLTLRYFRDELSMADVSGGTFTITDLSQQGATHFVPVLNDRQSAILGICAEQPSLGYQNMVLAFDHRMSDGMRGAAFLGELRTRMEG